MSYRKNYTFEEFENIVLEAFSFDFGEAEYKSFVSKLMPRVRGHVFPGKTVKEVDLLWGKWFETIDPGPVLGKKNHLLNLQDFNQERIKDLGGDNTNVFYAIAVHYRLHRTTQPELLELAAEIDKAVLSGLKFAESLGQAVFVYEPNFYGPFPALSAPMSYPPYKTKKQVADILIKDEDHSIWLDPHNHYSLKLVGRDKEFARLDKFVEQPGNFRIFPIIAPSGAGKTRLVSEWMKPFVVAEKSFDWEAGFLLSDSNKQARLPEPWKEWVIGKNTIIVIDYTHAFDAVIRQISELAQEQQDYKIRLIVVDHIEPAALTDDFLWGAFEGGHKSSIESFNYKYVEEPLRIKPASDGSETLAYIIAYAASANGGKYSPQDPVIVEALW